MRPNAGTARNPFAMPPTAKLPRPVCPSTSPSGIAIIMAMRTAITV